MFDEKEAAHIIFAGLLIAYLIVFPDITLFNSIKALIFATLILVPHVLAHKAAATNYIAEAKFKLLEWRRYWFFEDSVFKYPFPIWLFLPIIILFVTLGRVKFFLIESFDLKWKPEKRVGRWYTELQEREIAIIALAGPMMNILLAFIGGVIFSITNVDIAKEFAILNAWFAFFTLLPIGNMDGTKVLFGGRARWTFFFSFTIVMLALLYIINIYITFVLALIVAILVGLWFTRVDIPPKKKVPIGLFPGK